MHSSVTPNSALPTANAQLLERWQRGEQCGVEALGEAFERIRGDEEQLLDLLYHEVLIREEFGQPADVEQFVARFPHIEEQLRRQFEVHAAVDHDWRGDGFEPTDPRLLRETSQPTLGADGRTSRLLRLTADISAPPGFELLEELGRGGSAIVFKARQQSLNRLVALKMILAGQFASEQSLERFRQEAQAVAQLQHPGIVQIHEVGEHHNLPFLSLEFVPGGTLHQLLVSGPLKNDVAARLVESLARTIHFAHERGIVHRDLKPGNVLLGEEWERSESSESTQTGDSEIVSSDSNGQLSTPKIGDFGLARLIDVGSKLTATGQVIGTPSYMAPEQARQAKTLSGPAADIYSLGAILYETLTGRPPFQAATILETLEQVCDQEPVSPRQLQPRLTADLETICLKCLEKTPSRRYSTALELAEDLARFLNHEPITARPSSLIERGRKWVHRRPAVAALLALLVLLTAFGWGMILREAQRANREAARANSNEATARRERDDAQAQRALADKERENARLARLRAETNFLKATVVVARLGELGMQLQHEPGQQATSSRLFDAVLEFYEQVLVEQGDDPLVRREAAVAFLRAAEIRELLGEQDRAASLANRAVELLEQLADQAASPATNRKLAEALQQQAASARNRRDGPSAADALRRSITLLTELLAKPEIVASETAHDEWLLAKAHGSLGMLLRGQQQYEASLTELRRGNDILRAATRRRGEDERCQLELAFSLNGIGDTLQSAQRPAEAEPFYLEAFDLCRTLREQQPDSQPLTFLHVRLLRNLVQMEARSARFDTADARLAEAETLLNRMAARFPDDTHCQRERLWFCQERVLLEFRRQNAESIELACRAELRALTDLLPRMPASANLDEQLAVSSYRFADWLWQRDRHADAREHYATALRQSQAAADRQPNNFLALQQVAWQHAVCPVSDLQDLKLARSLADRAVKLAQDNPFAWRALGAVQLRAKEYTAAEASLRRSLQHQPSTEFAVSAHALLALTLHHLDQRAEALQELDLANHNSLSPTLPTISQIKRLESDARAAITKR